MDIFILARFYSFLNESFEIYIEDEGYHVSILELIEFKNILRFVTVSVDACVCAEAKSIFEALVLSILLLLLLLLLLLALLRLPYSGARKSDSEWSMLNTIRSMPYKLVFRPE